MKVNRLVGSFVAVGLVALAVWLAAGSAAGASRDETPAEVGSTSDGATPAAPTGTPPDQQAGDGFQWFWAINGPVSADAGGDLSVDDEGNVFLAGSHSGLDMDQDGVVDFASGATAYEGAQNPLFMKLNRGPGDDRVRLRWMRSPRTPADRSATKIVADGRGGAYVIGAFMESIAFEDGPTLPAAGGNDAYVARYDPDGAVVWARVFGGPGSDGVYGIASDREANVYVAGLGEGTFPLGDATMFQATGARSAVLFSYDPEGTVRWARVFGSGAPFVFNVRVSPSGEVYAAGELEGAADLDGDGTVDLPAPRDRDGFVARFSTEGALLGAWAVPVPGALAFAPNGDVLFASGMGGPLEQRYGPVDIDGDGRADVELRGEGPTGAWVARFSPDGELRWVHSYALNPADLEIRGDQIALSGNYTGVPDLDEDGTPEPADRTVDPALETDLAILILSGEDGHPVRVWTAPGPGNDVASAVAFLPGEPSLVATGSIQITADFSGDGERGEGWVVCENRGDVFFAQYRLPEVVTELRAEAPRAEPREPAREEPGEETTREITFQAALAEREGRLEADLVWSGISGAQVDIYRKGVLIATVANDGTHTDVIERGQVRRPYRYRVCAAGTQTCTATVEATF